MIVTLWIIGYLLGAFASLVIQKCAGLWGRYTSTDVTANNILCVIIWPMAVVVLTIALIVTQIDRLSDVVVAKVCPSAKS